MADWYLAQSLVALRTEINRRWPNRDRASDGAVGDTSHAARKSDHNPDWDAGGVVRAIDVDKDGINVQQLLEATIGDPRVYYVIWDRHIYSRTYGWAKRPYTGSNPHDKHVHISIRSTRTAERDTSAWFNAATPTPNPKDWFDMATPAEIEAAVKAGVLGALYEYGRAFFKDEAGTGDTLMDEARAHHEKVETQLANIERNTGASQ